MQPNLKRMLAIIDETFATRKDPNQLQVTENDIQKLQNIHPSTLSEFADKDGPAIWVLLIPTTKKIMDDFLSGKISERNILERTEAGENYNAIYLCSVTTLPEYRGKGLTKKLAIKAIESIRKIHPIKYLFVWPFTKEGDALAKKISEETGMELKEKENQ
jgi:hypothetical protein